MYDICFSFAGEDRGYVEPVHAALSSKGLKLFYDYSRENVVNLWGKDLVDELANVYRKDSRFCLMFVSKSYVEKAFTKHERQHAMARQLVEEYAYLLPARLDDTEVPGLSPMVGYIDCRSLKPEQLAALVEQKIHGTRLISADQVFLWLARHEYGVLINQVGKILKSHGDAMSAREKSFLLYNLACAESCWARDFQEAHRRNGLLSAAEAHIVKWWKHLKSSGVMDLSEGNAHFQADDDLLLLRQQRSESLKAHFGKITKVATGSGGGCVSVTTRIASPDSMACAADLAVGTPLWSVIQMGATDEWQLVTTKVATSHKLLAPRAVRINGQLKCTERHRIYVLNVGWVCADQIAPGMSLCLASTTFSGDDN